MTRRNEIGRVLSTIMVSLVTFILEQNRKRVSAPYVVQTYSRTQFKIPIANESQIPSQSNGARIAGREQPFHLIGVISIDHESLTHFAALDAIETALTGLLTEETAAKGGQTMRKGRVSHAPERCKLNWKGRQNNLTKLPGIRDPSAVEEAAADIASKQLVCFAPVKSVSGGIIPEVGKAGRILGELGEEDIPVEGSPAEGSYRNKFISTVAQSSEDYDKNCG
ncbi:hypothetical protein P175DRAFT_0532969 [Aspergillus ochraceoroseus IBT 24754]|uniref:Uncharacterized protein n=1 Tax=Aspergillus ochraceoroseus IBT 24754 TaxID=1392256 RepID=A0A2T5LUN7_9EURO|nr:uncharacterized protein P175DRAFT_0532969 [Aspergillus ochraceoroseus IBT 24754]PTU19998.1 hypothetical protein P175DRAFT_0532969 [Aspergillus ochraceoroseus IBT 24754]